MSDPTLFRGRLTGLISEDASDTAPAGEKGALVEFVREDTTGAGEEKGMARVLLPNNVPCPVYAAKLHLFHTLGVITPPLDLELQPPVIIRRDLTSLTPATVCQSTVIHPSYTALMTVKFGTATEEVIQGENAALTFFDHLGNTAITKLAYLPVEADAPPIVGKGTLVCVFQRVPIESPMPAAPGSRTHSWIMAGVGMGDHRHLRAGPGVNGGGPAFAAFAPSTVAEATGLGYTL